jgi:prevent-host-death family protein
MAEQIGIEDARKNLGPLVHRVQHGGAEIILTRNGKPAARIVPIPQEPAVTDTYTDAIRDAYLGARKRQWATIHDHVAAYLTGTPADLFEVPWWRAWFGNTQTSQTALTVRRDEFAAALGEVVDLEMLRIAVATGRQYDEPAVLAEVDMDAAYLRVAASVLRAIVTEELDLARRSALFQAEDEDGEVNEELALRGVGELEQRVLAMLPPE